MNNSDDAILEIITAATEAIVSEICKLCDTDNEDERE